MSIEVHATYHFARLPEWILYHPDLTPTDILVYCVFDRYDGKACIPARKTVADKLGISDKTVSRSIKSLEDVGAIVSNRRFRADGSQTSNSYTLAGDVPLGGTQMSPPLDTSVQPPLLMDVPAEPEQVDPENVTTSHSRGPRKSDPVWDTLAELFGEAKTTGERGKRGKTTRELKEVGATEEQIRYAFRRWGAVFPRATCTERALVNHWTKLTHQIEKSASIIEWEEAQRRTREKRSSR